MRQARREGGKGDGIDMGIMLIFMTMTLKRDEVTKHNLSNSHIILLIRG